MRTGLFFQREELWTDDSAKAHDFRNMASVIQFAFEQDLEHVDILMEFEDPHFNIRLPLRP